MAIELLLSAPSAAECHPNCDGSCTVAASPSKCTACIAGTELKDSICKKTSPTVPPGEAVNLADDNWSTPTEEKDKGSLSLEEQARAYLELAQKEEYRPYIAAGAGGTLCLVCCIILFCCCCGAAATGASGGGEKAAPK